MLALEYVRVGTIRSYRKVQSMAVTTRKGQTYRASSPDLTPFDPIRDTVGNRPNSGAIRAAGTGATNTTKKGGTYKAANTPAKRKQEPTLPRRDYTQP